MNCFETGQTEPARSPQEAPLFSKRITTTAGPVEMDIYWVRGDDLHGSACDLVNRRYAWRGYGDHHEVKRSSSHATFTAVTGGAVVGTVTLAVDSPAGLSADGIFRQELDAYRSAPRAHICEIVKLAAGGDVHSPAILAALFHVILLYGQLNYSCSDLFIEVNPRHRRFYEAMLGFEPIGSVKTNGSVGAPSQLMHLAVNRIRPMIQACRGNDQSPAGRSLYPHFLSPGEEEAILMKLCRLMSEEASAEGGKDGGISESPAGTTKAA